MWASFWALTVERISRAPEPLSLMPPVMKLTTLLPTLGRKPEPRFPINSRNHRAFPAAVPLWSSRKIVPLPTLRFWVGSAVRFAAPKIRLLIRLRLPRFDWELGAQVSQLRLPALQPLRLAVRPAAM